MSSNRSHRNMRKVCGFGVWFCIYIIMFLFLPCEHTVTRGAVLQTPPITRAVGVFYLPLSTGASALPSPPMYA